MYIRVLCLFIGVALSTSVAQPPCTTAAAKPAPSGYHCGEQGTLKTPSPSTTTTTSDQVTCRNSCLSSTTCTSFSYNTAKKQCITSTKTMVAQGFKSSTTSGVYYFNRHCFTITCPTCPASQSYCPNLQGCTNLQTDNSNCGSCGNLCSAAQSCVKGACVCTPTPPFYLQVQNSGTCLDDGHYPSLSNNSTVGQGYTLASKNTASSSPEFYITFFNGDGACAPSGTLTLTKAGSQDQPGFVDPADNHLVHFNTTQNIPVSASRIINCRIDYTNNHLVCTADGSPGFWFTCCTGWRIGTDDQIASFNKTHGRCQKIDMVAQYVFG